MEALFALYDPEIVWESRYGPLTGTYRGHEGVRQFFREWMDPLESFDAQADEFVDAGDDVVVVARITARGRGSGVEVDMPQGQLYSVRNGRVVRVELHETKAQAREAAGREE
jgi:ketosteroid isomerase-like protein